MSASAFSLPKAPPVRWSSRGEFRRALLAAGETCWVYAVVATIAALGNASRVISPLSLFVAYWLALELGRFLPQLPRPFRVLQLVNVGLAAAIIVALLRLDLYREVPLLDLAWFPYLLGRLFGSYAVITPEQISALALLYMYVRGIGFGLRPLTLWFVGFQFRLGIIVLFLTALFGILTRRVDLTAPACIFFAVSLLGIALARIEESGREMALGPRWALVLAAGCLLVVLLGLLFSPLFTLASSNLILAILEPLAPLLVLILGILLVPIYWIVTAIILLLSPIINLLVNALKGIELRIGGQLFQVPSNFQPVLPDAGFLLPYAKFLAILAVLLAVGFVVARALNRHIMQMEEESFVRESAGPEQGTSRETGPRVRPRPPRPLEIEAENIRRIYAALLHRSALMGLPKREAETPYEFLPRLVELYPEAAPDLDALTEAYVSVHYAEIPATSEQVREMRTVWQRLKRQLIKKP